MTPGIASLQQRLEDGAAQGVFPHASAVVFIKGVERFSGATSGASASTQFDLASLTKVMSTTSAFLWLWSEGQVAPSTPLSAVLPDAPLAKTGATFEDLLTHRAGLPAYVPYFAEAFARWPVLLKQDVPRSVRADARAWLIQQALSTALSHPQRTRAVYSDVGFISLGAALETLTQQPLDALWSQELLPRLGLQETAFRRLSNPGTANSSQANPPLPTGGTRPREPAPGQALVWSGRTIPSPPGEVDDDNAWVMDGVAGHAGLFGTARDVARFGQAILDGLSGRSALAPEKLWQHAVRTDGTIPGSTRALGFDTPSAQGSSAGSRLGQRPPGAVGHLGFTGVSLWVDLARELVVALCTNRTHLGRERTAIQTFRPNFHDAVLEEFFP